VTRSSVPPPVTAVMDAAGAWLPARMAQVEERLAAISGGYGERLGEEAEATLNAGGKRLRPLLVFFATPPDDSPSVAAGVAVELVHMATLVHDDLIDGAEFRRGRASAWSAYGPAAARATGDYLFARAFAELAATGDEEAVSLLAQAALCLARGEAMQRRQAHDPETTVDAYLERCGLKTGKLFEAACLLGGGVGKRHLGAFGLALGIAFQITDDILDCSGETVETGKIAGVDLREGTPTLPLIFAAREDEVVRMALAGGPLDGALVRVAATGALERARDVALDYAHRAGACLNGELHRAELEALTHLVVHREA
jgi:geranylgeranyl pyrophosphate synthase